eukprot:3936925-Rhodomonas_salina.2
MHPGHSRRLEQQLLGIQGGYSGPLRDQRGESRVHWGLSRSEGPFRPILIGPLSLCLGFGPVPSQQGGVHGDQVREWMSAK